MQSKLRFVSILLAAIVFIFSCSKDNDTPVTPQPELFDTLGAGWQRIQIDAKLHFEDVWFINTQTGFLCADKYVGKSTDGGLTWKKCIPDSLGDSFSNLYFADANNGWVFGGFNFFIRTKDGGLTWQKINIGNIFDGQFFDANNGYLISSTGATAQGLSKTSDGGITLQSVSILSASPAALYFLNQNKGWYSTNFLNKTENAGLAFSTFNSTNITGTYAMQFTDALHGWMAGSKTIYKTVDGGATIETVPTNATTGSGDIHFFDNNNGFILSGGKIYSTTDGGKTVNQLCAIHKSFGFEIYFTDPNHGWMGGSNGYLYKYVKP